MWFISYSTWNFSWKWENLLFDIDLLKSAWWFYFVARYTYYRIGAWRSLVARFHGVEEVARSNRVAPTILFTCCRWKCRICHSCECENPTRYKRTFFVIQERAVRSMRVEESQSLTTDLVNTKRKNYRELTKFYLVSFYLLYATRGAL